LTWFTHYLTKRKRKKGGVLRDLVFCSFLFLFFLFLIQQRNGGREGYYH
jgi:hypothetical protein